MFFIYAGMYVTVMTFVLLITAAIQLSSPILGLLFLVIAHVLVLLFISIMVDISKGGKK